MKTTIAALMLAACTAIAEPIYLTIKNDSVFCIYRIEQEQKVGIGGRGILRRVRIVEPPMPTDKETELAVRAMVDSVLTSSYRGGTATIFAYVADMPITFAAYAMGEREYGSTNTNYRLNKETLPLWRMNQAEQKKAPEKQPQKAKLLPW